MRHKRAVLVGSAICVGALVTAGCGGGSAENLTKKEFLKQGNAICAEGTKHINAAGQTAFTSPGSPTEQETVAFAEQVVVPTVQDELDQLRALSPPKDDEARVKEILRKAQAAVDKVKANPALLGKENGSDEANRLTSAYGLTACAG